MRALRNRILSAIGTGLTLHGVTSCVGTATMEFAGDANTTKTVSDSPAPRAEDAMGAADGIVEPTSERSDLGSPDGATDIFDARVDAIAAAADGSGSSSLGVSDAMGASDAIAESRGLIDAGIDGSGSCTCSMLYGPCGAANPCGCCAGHGLLCSGSSACFVPPGRPFLVGSSLRSAKAVARSDWMRHRRTQPLGLDQRTAHALQRAWLDDALQEHASVAAFARFTLQLLAVGAPPELIVASQRASLDEVAHARACFELARRYGACDVGPSSIDVQDSVGAMSIVDLCTLTAAEGCAGETLGAALAAEQLARACDVEVAGVLRRIASDELRHAEFAWRFARWAVERVGEPAWQAIERGVREVVESRRHMPILDYGVDEGVWNTHGRVTFAQARQVIEQAFVEVIDPCLQALAAVAASARRHDEAAQRARDTAPTRAPWHWCDRVMG